MIAPLRRRHRWISWALLAVPALVIAALAVRPEADAFRTASDDGLAPAAGAVLAGDAFFTSDDLFGDFPIRLRLAAGDQAPVVELTPLEALRRPDVLAYWSDRSAAGELPGEAQLLGPLVDGRPRAYPLPRAVLDAPGHLLLYSLAHRQVFAAAPLPAAVARGQGR